MSRMKTLCCGIWIVVATAGPVAAGGDATAPSLRMRARAHPATHWSPSYWTRRVAQAAPDPASAEPASDASPPTEPAAPAAAAAG